MADYALPLLRHALTLAGGVLITKGIADEGTVQALVGGTMAALSVGWAAYAKRQSIKAAAA